MDEYASAKEMADTIIKESEKYQPELVNLASMFLKLQSQLIPCDAKKMLNRLLFIRNRTLEDAATQVERLTGRKRGEINRETAEYIRRLKKTA